MARPPGLAEHGQSDQHEGDTRSSTSMLMSFAREVGTSGRKGHFKKDLPSASTARYVVSMSETAVLRHATRAGRPVARDYLEFRVPHPGIVGRPTSQSPLFNGTRNDCWPPLPVRHDRPKVGSSAPDARLGSSPDLSSARSAGHVSFVDIAGS